MILWVAVACAAGIASIFLWGFFGLALLLIPVVGIGVMIREIWRELRGKRPTYTAGVVDLSEIPSEPTTIRHFATRFPTKSGGGRRDDVSE